MKITQTAAIATMVVGASAQSTTMPKDTMAKGDSMAMAKSGPTSYTGCVEAGSTAGSYLLTHFSADMAMGAGSMGKDAVKADAMKKDAMMSEHLMLTSKASLAPHVGHKVTVSGKGADKMSFAVSAVKMVASSCP